MATSRLKPEPKVVVNTFVPSKALILAFDKGLPLIGFTVIWLLAQYAAHLKGDKQDREDVRAYELTEKKKKRDLQARNRKIAEASMMAARGCTLLEIKRRMEDLKVGDALSDDEIRDMIRDAQRKRAQTAAAKRATPWYEELMFWKSSPSPSTQKKVNTDEQYMKQLLEARRRKQEAASQEGDENAAADKMVTMSTMKVTSADREGKRRAKRKSVQSMSLKEKLSNKVKIDEDDTTVFFDQVAGIGEAKRELQEVVDFFTQGQRFRDSGAKMPKGVLLCGPPGTGKTLLARAVAGEAGADFISVNASEFVEMFVGVGAARVRDLFNAAKGLARVSGGCIIFMDEIDAVGRVRGGAQGNDERDNTLNQLLSCMDGFDSETNVVVIGATNRKDILDPALIRPGRFDRIVQVDPPDFSGRIDVLKVHLADKLVAEDVTGPQDPKRGVSLDEEIYTKSLGEIAYEAQGWSGAQLSNLANQASRRGPERLIKLNRDRTTQGETNDNNDNNDNNNSTLIIHIRIHTYTCVSNPQVLCQVWEVFSCSCDCYTPGR